MGDLLTPGGGPRGGGPPGRGGPCIGGGPWLGGGIPRGGGGPVNERINQCTLLSKLLAYMMQTYPHLKIRIRNF